jgi:hypothetical protein
MAQRVSRMLALLGLLLSVMACQSKSGGDGRSATGMSGANGTSPQPMGKHWIQDERLRSVMGSLAKHMQDHYPSGLPNDPEQPTPPEITRAFADASKLADGLAEGAQRIPQAIEGNAKISAEDRAGFHEEARTLRTHALDLKSAADEKRLEGMQRSLLGINATCIACHSKYKDISGEINFPRAAASAIDSFAARQ